MAWYILWIYFKSYWPASTVSLHSLQSLFPFFCDDCFIISLAIGLITLCRRPKVLIIQLVFIGETGGSLPVFKLLWHLSTTNGWRGTLVPMAQRTPVSLLNVICMFVFHRCQSWLQILDLLNELLWANLSIFSHIHYDCYNNGFSSRRTWCQLVQLLDKQCYWIVLLVGHFVSKMWPTWLPQRYAVENGQKISKYGEWNLCPHRGIHSASLF